MSKNKGRDLAVSSAPQQADFSFQLGRAHVTARVQLSSAGLLAVGAMVSGILLSTAMLVGVALASGRMTRR